MPPTTPTAEGMLVWKLGELAPGDERSITMQLIPDVQGDIGSVASVQFATQASVHTVATMPKLELRLDTRSEVLIGGRHQVRATLVNTGSGTARGVRLEADIPTQLRHSTGDQQLEAPLGDLAPQQSRSIDLDLAAVNPGRSNCTIRVITDDGPQAEESVAIEVKAAQLLAQIDGPKMRYLDRPATFRVQVVNSGTASATNCEFLINLPIGLEFRGANNSGSYDPNTHSITWGLEELPTSEPAIIEFDVIPRSLGPQAMRFSAQGDLGVVAEARAELQVEGLAELQFTIGQDNGTIETGSSTTYTVQIRNNGNKPDTQVQLVVQLPTGCQVQGVDAQGLKWGMEGTQLIFAPLPEMRSQDQHTYRFQIRHNQPGTKVVRAQLTSANWPVAVVKEEGTLVYDEN